MKAEGKIDGLWTFNGIINVRKKDTTDDNIYKHYDELYDHFNDEVKNELVDVAIHVQKALAYCNIFSL